MPRYSRRKWAASNRASTRTLYLLAMVLRENVLDQPFGRTELPKLLGRALTAQQLHGPRVVPARVRRAFIGQFDELQQRLAAAFLHGIRSVQCAPIRDAAAKKHSLYVVQEDLPRGLAALPILRVQRDRAETRAAGQAIHGEEDPRVRAAHRQDIARVPGTAARAARAGRASESPAETAGSSSRRAAATAAAEAAAAPASTTAAAATTTAGRRSARFAP